MGDVLFLNNKVISIVSYFVLSLGDKFFSLRLLLFLSTKLKKGCYFFSLWMVWHLAFSVGFLVYLTASSDLYLAQV